MHRGEKLSDKYGRYGKSSIAAIIFFIIALGLLRLILYPNLTDILPLDNWFTSVNSSIYGDGLIFKDSGSILKLQTTFSLSDVVYIPEPTLVIIDGIIPSRTMLNGKDISITEIFPSRKQDTYIIAYRLPLSYLKYFNQITLIYTSKDIAGWKEKSFIASFSKLNGIFSFYKLTFALDRYGIPILALIGTITFMMFYLYTKEYAVFVFSEVNMLFLLTGFLLRTTYHNYTLYQFLGIAIGLLILQQLSVRDKYFSILLVQWALFIPLILGIFGPKEYTEVLKILTLIAVIITAMYQLIHCEDDELPIIYWLITFMSFILVEDIFKELISPMVYSSAASILGGLSATYLLGGLALYYYSIPSTVHPINLILSLKRKEEPFSSIFIKSQELLSDHTLIHNLIVPELCRKDAYTITDKGIWIIKAGTTHEEIVNWIGNLQSKLRIENGITDTKIGVLEIEYLPWDLAPWKVLKETEKLVDMAKYPDFIKMKRQL